MSEWEVIGEEPLQSKVEWEVVDEQPISAITSQRIHTGAEQIQMGRHAASVMGPIAGDIAGTLLAPQFKAAQVAARAPRLAMQGANLLSRMTGAGVGGYGGSVAGQAMEGNGIDQREALVQGGIGAATELGIPAVGAVAGKVGRPALNLVSDMTWTGKRVKTALRHRLQDRATKQAQTMLSDMAPEFVKEMGTDLGTLSSKIDSAFDETRIFYDQAEKQLDEATKETGGLFKMNSVRDFLDGMYQKTAKDMPLSKNAAIENAVIKEFGMKPGEYNASILRKVMNDEQVSSADAKHLLATLFEKGKWDKLGPGYKALREKLKTVAKDDVAAAIGNAGLRETADAQWKALKRFNFVKSLYDRATFVMPNTAKEILDPSKFGELIYQNKGRILRDTPELWPQLKKEADFLLKEVVPKMRELKQAPGESLIGAGIGFAAGGAGGVPVVEGIGALSALALMAPGDQAILKGVLKYGTKSSAHTMGDLLMPAHGEK